MMGTSGGPAGLAASSVNKHNGHNKLHEILHHTLDFFPPRSANLLGDIQGQEASFSFHQEGNSVSVFELLDL